LHGLKQFCSTETIVSPIEYPFTKQVSCEKITGIVEAESKRNSIEGRNKFMHSKNNTPDGFGLLG
jgi:hypothetical protein